MIKLLIALLQDAVTQALCKRGWHSWQHEPERRVNGSIYGPYKTCTRCMQSHFLLPKLPAGHPDATPVKLTAEQIKWLAQVELSFSEETR